MDGHGVGPDRVVGPAVLGGGAPVLIPDLEQGVGGQESMAYLMVDHLDNLRSCRLLQQFFYLLVIDFLHLRGKEMYSGLYFVPPPPLTVCWTKLKLDGVGPNDNSPFTKPSKVNSIAQSDFFN